MDLGFLASLSWRELLMAIVVLLVLYILFSFLCINRLRNESRRMRELSPDSVLNAVTSYAAVQESGQKTSKTAADAVVRDGPPDSAVQQKEETFAWNEPPSAEPESRRLEILEQDLAQLRREIGGLRAEVSGLREKQRRGENKVQVAQNASSFYSDAMQLAAQGREAGDISVQCGISRAEAELVVALVKNKGQAPG